MASEFWRQFQNALGNFTHIYQKVMGIVRIDT